MTQDADYNLKHFNLSDALAIEPSVKEFTVRPRTVFSYRLKSEDVVFTDGNVRSDAAADLWEVAPIGLYFERESQAGRMAKKLNKELGK